MRCVHPPQRRSAVKCSKPTVKNIDHDEFCSCSFKCGIIKIHHSTKQWFSLSPSVKQQRKLCNDVGFQNPLLSNLHSTLKQLQYACCTHFVIHTEAMINMSGTPRILIGTDVGGIQLLQEIEYIIFTAGEVFGNNFLYAISNFFFIFLTFGSPTVGA